MPTVEQLRIVAALLAVARKRGFIVWVDAGVIRLAERETPRQRTRIRWATARHIVDRGWWKRR